MVNKQVITSSAPLKPSDKKDQAPDGGWRVKEWKTNSSSVSVGQTKHSFPSLPINVIAEDEPPSIFERLGLWCYGKRWIGILAAMSTTVVLVMVMGTSSSWLVSPEVSKPAVAATHDAPTPTPAPALAPAPEPELAVQESRLNTGYLLHLGSFRSQLGARLMWAGLTADPGMLLQGFDPIFRSDDGTVFDVLVGTYSSHDAADGHCAWLTQNNITCAVVGG